MQFSCEKKKMLCIYLWFYEKSIVLAAHSNDWPWPLKTMPGHCLTWANSEEFLFDDNAKKACAMKRQSLKFLPPWLTCKLNDTKNKSNIPYVWIKMKNMEYVMAVQSFKFIESR